MAQNTREDIIACARRLFEERGYNGVSMRDIAGALGISVGNLTYHFKKKESLLEAILLSAGQSRQKLPPPRTLEELRQYFLHMLEAQQAYAFYFDSYHQLAQTSPTLARIHQELLGSMILSILCRKSEVFSILHCHVYSLSLLPYPFLQLGCKFFGNKDHLMHLCLCSASHGLQAVGSPQKCFKETMSNLLG